MIQVLEEHSPEQIHTIKRFNEYMSNATKKYESGIKLDGPIEALTLSNILSINDGYNIYGANQEDWEEDIKKALTTPLPAPDKSIYSIIEEYSSRILEDSNALSEILLKYEHQQSTSNVIKLCLESLTNVRNITWTYSNTKDEGMFIKHIIDPVLITPLCSLFSQEVIQHGNWHTLKESKHQKELQSKQNGDSIKGCRGRSSDRFLELGLDHIYFVK